MERRPEDEKPARARESSSELVGSYLLLHELARGEHTTVHLARKQGPLGFQRLFALKRLRAGFENEPDYVQMLLDEAHLTAGLHHANLIGVLDVGNESGCHVISEYVEGENLERLLQRAGSAMHLRYVLPLFVDLLNGLEAVHNAVGADEAPLELVHQAPSARHVLVGVDGIARLTDFSQARARTLRPLRARTERLRVSHMAPEQALAPERVDARADLFIVGISLWEALTGEPLFAADSDELTFQNLLHRRIPRPSEVGRMPPPCFDAICMRALERDPNARYASAAEMARALRDVAMNQVLYATPTEIGDWVKRVLGNELSARRRKLGDMDTQQIRLAGVDGLRADATAQARPEQPSAGVSRPKDVSGVWDDAPTSTRAVGPHIYAIPRDDEPTSPRLSVEPDPIKPGHKRVSTLPYAPTLETASQPPQPAQAADALESEPTRPSVVAPGARRDGQVVSPGAYSQVEARRTRSKRPSGDQPATSARESSPAAPASISSIPPSPFASFDANNEAASAAADGSPDPSFKPKRPSDFPRPLGKRPEVKAAAASELPPLPTTFDWPMPASATAAASDVASARLESPASQPQHVAHSDVSQPVLASILPSGEAVGSVLSSLPKTFEALQAEEQARRSSAPPAWLAERQAQFSTPPELSPFLPPEPAPAFQTPSFGPSNVAEWTVPPSAARPRHKLGAWVGSGLVAAVILLAMGLGARRWMLEGAPTSAAAREEFETQPLGAMPEELAVEAQPQTEPAAASPAAASTPSEQPLQEQAGEKPGALKPETAQQPKPGSNSARPRVVVRPQARDKAPSLAAPASATPASARPAEKARPAKSAPALPTIPDNPY